MHIASNTEYDIGRLPKEQTLVECEEGVRQEARIQLHDLAVEVLKSLGIQGRFALPGSGNNQTIGEPDFCWLCASTKHSKLVVRVSTIFNF
jgi:hypothetical protein